MKTGGIGIYTCDDVQVIVDTAKCRHCQAPIDIPDRRRLTDYADFCRNCMGPICLKEACYVCVPWQRKIDAKEAEAYRAQQFRKMVGI